MYVKNIYFAFLSILLLNSCNYDNEESLYGISDCDTNFVSFEMDISPIISAACEKTCHAGPSPSAGLALETYTQIKSSALNGSYSGMINRIEKPEGTPLGMPPNYRLELCQIQMIKAWVEQGALNN